MGEYTKDEFFRGFQRLNCDSVSAMKKKLPTLRKELSDDDKFKDTYEYAFGFSREKGQKSLTLDTAIGMWKLLFGIYEWTLCDSWCDFIETNHKKVSEYRVPHSLQNCPRADALLSPSPPPLLQGYHQGHVVPALRVRQAVRGRPVQLRRERSVALPDR